MRILIVDDSAVMRSMERKMLTALGVTETVEASDGLQALTAVAAGNFDLILMDWRMPVLSGLETLKQLKAMPDFQSIPVVMITSESQKTKILEAIQAGAANYIIKPFTEENLREKIHPYLKKEAA